jgi:PKD repeat protein
MRKLTLIVGLVFTLSLAFQGHRLIAQVKGPTSCLPAPSGMVAWWPGDGNSQDISGINNGIPQNGATFTIGKVGQSFSFDGTNDHIRIPDSNRLDFDTTLTIDAWIRPTSIPNSFPTILAKWDVTAVNQRSYSFTLDPSRKVVFRVSPNGREPGFPANLLGSIISNGAVPLNDWTHVVGMYDGQFLKIYINGTLDKQVNYNQGIFVGTDDVAIGAVVGGAAQGQHIAPFAGLIDEVSLYNRALTGSEIQAIYNEDSQGKCKPCNFTSCTATVPTTGTVGMSIEFSASATSSCTAMPTYDWNFGDRNAHSSQSNTTHVYNAAGSYSWTLTTNVPGATSCVKTGHITINPPSQYCLTTSVSPPGVGTVTPSGVTCHNRGTSILVEARPIDGYRFGYWSGDVFGSSTAPNEPVQMNRDKELIAHFVPLATSLSGTIRISDGQNSWPLNGNGITCLRVFVETQGTITNRIEAQVNRSLGTYTFDNLPTGTYDLSVIISYTDTVNVDTTSLNSGCLNLPLHKTTRYQRSINTTTLTDPDIYIPPPLVMVHGIQGCYQKWYSPDGVNCSSNTFSFDIDWDSTARGQGFITFTPNYYWKKDNDHSWELLATQVRTQVEANLRALSSQTNNGRYPPWVYIGHSQGGLVARVLARGDSRYAPVMRSLKKVYLLGTPNSGSLSTGLGMAHFITTTVTQTPYLQQSPMRKEFNIVYDSFGSKDSVVKVFAGTKDSLLRNDFTIRPESSDGYVPVDSVHNIYQRLCMLGLCVERRNRHYDGPDFPYDHKELGSFQSRDILSSSILPEIQSGMTGQASPNARAAVSEPTIGLRSIAKETITLTANQTDLLEITVGATDRIEINTSISSGLAMFSLLDPSGQIIDFSSIPSVAGGHTSNVFGDSFLLYNPVAGVWTLRAVAGASQVNYSVDIAENSPVGFDGFIARPTVLSGEISHLIGQWANDFAGVTSASITAQLADESSTLVGTINLHDDGMHGDGAAGDGVFGGDSSALFNPGQYTVTFTAQGIFNNQTFTRWAQASVDVVSSAHLFTGDFTDGVYDSDQDDVFDTLQETVVVSVPAAGNYIVTADLEDGQGYFIDHAVGSLVATASGAYSIGLEFKVDGVFCSQFNTPFLIKNLTLSEAGSLKVLDIWNGNVLTQTYDSGLFDCAKGTPAPAVNNVQPAALFSGQSRKVIVSGNSFANGAQVFFGPSVTVSSVSFASPSILLAQISVAAGATPGPRDVTVTNPDGRTVIISGLFSVASDQPPTASINNIADQQEVTGVVTVSATATDDLGIQKVEFYLDGVLSATDLSFPYQFVWDTSGLSNGPHAIAAKAYDTANNTATSQITPVASCVSTLSPSRFFFQATGGSGTLNVISPGLCAWSVLTNDNWIVVTSDELDNGIGRVTFEARENLTANARTGILTVGARTITVTQNGLGVCQYSISPTFESFSTNGGTGSIQVTAAQGCAWQTITSSGWITITSSSTGIGSGTMTYSVSSNTGPAGRNGTITVAGQTFSIKQKGT